VLETGLVVSPVDHPESKSIQVTHNRVH